MELQIIATIAVGLIIAHIFTFSENFMSPYSFKLPTSVHSFQSVGSLGHVLQGKSSGHELLQLLSI